MTQIASDTVVDGALQYIDLQRYPIDALATAPARALVARARAELDRRGACELSGFLHPIAVQYAVVESTALASVAFASHSSATAYLTAPDQAFAGDHPRNHVMRSRVRVVGYDQIPTHHVVRRVYESALLADFLARVLDLPILHRYADPMGALNLAVMSDGDELHWHFDQTDFVASIPLVPAAAGGYFEVHPLLRNATDERYSAVADALRGTGPPPVRLAMQPGSLLLFQGRNSMHRVTPVQGTRARIVALLAFDAKPGTDSTAELKLARYGRTHPL